MLDLTDLVSKSRNLILRFLQVLMMIIVNNYRLIEISETDNGNGHEVLKQ